MSELIKFIFLKNDLITELLLFSGMAAHTIFYQNSDKEMGLDFSASIAKILPIGFVMIANEILLTFTQFFTIGNLTSKFPKKWALVLFCIFTIFFQVLLQIYLLWLNIGGYYKTFAFFKYVYIFGNLIKLAGVLFENRFVLDLVRLFDPIWIINMMLILVTDPMFNEEGTPNKLCFHEIYFRFLEFQVLVIGFNILMFDSSIDYFVEKKQYTLSAVIGRYDSFRYVIFLLLIHYFFTIINAAAFSIRYLFGLFSIFFAIYAIGSYRQRYLIHTYIAYLLVLAINIGCYLYVLYTSPPVIGDGSREFLEAQLLLLNSTSNTLDQNITSLSNTTSNTTI